jgi:hypothetical protein
MLGCALALPTPPQSCPVAAPPGNLQGFPGFPGFRSFSTTGGRASNAPDSFGLPRFGRLLTRQPEWVSNIGLSRYLDVFACRYRTRRRICHDARRAWRTPLARWARQAPRRPSSPNELPGLSGICGTQNEGELALSRTAANYDAPTPAVPTAVFPGSSRLSMVYSSVNDSPGLSRLPGIQPEVEASPTPLKKNILLLSHGEQYHESAKWLLVCVSSHHPGSILTRCLVLLKYYTRL